MRIKETLVIRFRNQKIEFLDKKHQIGDKHALGTSKDD